MTIIFINMTIFLDISKWNKWQIKWDGGSKNYYCYGLFFASLSYDNEAPYLTFVPYCPLWGLFQNTRKWAKACAKSNPIIFPLHLYMGMNFLPKFFTSNGWTECEWISRPTLFDSYNKWALWLTKKNYHYTKWDGPYYFHLHGVGLTAELYLSSRLGSMGPIIKISYS